MCFLLSCVEVQHSMPFILHASSFSFCVLGSAALATSLLTKQSRPPTSLLTKQNWPEIFFLLRVFVSVLCHIILNFPNQHPPSQCSARIQGIAWIRCSSWLMRLIQEEILAVWMVLCQTVLSDLIYLLCYSPWSILFNLLLVVDKFLLLLGSALGGPENPVLQSLHLLFPWPRAAVAAFSCASGSSKLIKPIYQSVTNALEYDLTLKMQQWALGTSHFCHYLHLFMLGNLCIEVWKCPA